jgi:hypothetical protein
MQTMETSNRTARDVIIGATLLFTLGAIRHIKLFPRSPSDVVSILSFSASLQLFNC